MSIVGLWANLRNAMFMRESAADSRFSRGRCQALVKAAPGADPGFFLGGGAPLTD